jgi:hypothetical protein
VRPQPATQEHLVPSRLARRRALAASAALALGTAGLTALVGTASAAGCASWTDPKGDATTAQEPSGVASDAQMDITAASLRTVGDSLVAAITTDGLSNSASDAGDRYRVRFTVGGQAVTMVVDRIAPPLVGDVDVYARTTGVATGEATAAFDAKTKTVTITAKLSEVDKSAGKKVAGQAASALSAETATHVANALSVLYDAAATTSTLLIGDTCDGSAAPAPAPTASASTAPSPSASPSASPTSSPSPSATGAPSPAPTGSPSAPSAKVLPRAGCFLFTDATGDARPLNANNPQNDPALDLTGLTVQTTVTHLVAYGTVPGLDTGPSASTDGARWSFRFTHNKHVFTAAASTYNNAPAANVRGGLSQTGQFGANVQLSVDTPPITDPNGRVRTGFVASGLAVDFDLASKVVVWRVPRADIEKYGEAPLVGSTLTAVDAISATDTGALSSQADQVTAATPEVASYRVGDNSCFATPTQLTSVGATSAQFSDVADVAVRLVDRSSGKPLAGRRVQVTLPGTTAFLTTASDGVARVRATMRTSAGAGTLTASFAGAEGVDKSELSVPFTVLLEKTALLATGSQGSVTATLRDDDRAPVAGATLVLTQGSTKRTVRTDAKGTAKAGGFKPGQPVKVSYAGDGRYAATSLNARA